MDHSPAAITALAPESRSTATILPPLERWVGRVTAAVAATVLEMMEEYQDRGLIPATKDRFKERLWCLYRVRQLLFPVWNNVDEIAREQGLAALRAADVSPRLAKIAIDATLETLHKVIRDTLN